MISAKRSSSEVSVGKSFAGSDQCILTDLVCMAFLGLPSSFLNSGCEAAEVPELPKSTGVATGIADTLAAQPPVDPADIEATLDRVRARQKAVGYDADYKTWIERAGKPC